MEEIVISNCRCQSQTQRIGDEADVTPRLQLICLRLKSQALEKELSEKDTIIYYLTKH